MKATNILYHEQSLFTNSIDIGLKKYTIFQSTDSQAGNLINYFNYLRKNSETILLNNPLFSI